MAKNSSAKAKREDVDQEIRDLVVTLSATERNSLGRRLADIHNTISQVELSKKAAMAVFTSRLKELAAEGSSLVSAIRDGQREQPVKCEVCYNHETAKVTVTRTDTGEQIEERPMTDEEKQLKIRFRGGSDNGARKESEQ